MMVFKAFLIALALRMATDEERIKLVFILLATISKLKFISKLNLTGELK